MKLRYEVQEAFRTGNFNKRQLNALFTLLTTVTKGDINKNRLDSEVIFEMPITKWGK